MLTQFTARMLKSENRGAWIYVVMPGAAQFFGTKGVVKVRGHIDGHPFQASFMAMGGGIHMLPLNAQIRQAIGKGVGDEVTVVIDERL